MTGTGLCHQIVLPPDACCTVMFGCERLWRHHSQVLSHPGFVHRAPLIQQKSNPSGHWKISRPS